MQNLKVMKPRMLRTGNGQGNETILYTIGRRLMVGLTNLPFIILLFLFILSPYLILIWEMIQEGIIHHQPLLFLYGLTPRRLALLLKSIGLSASVAALCLGVSLPGAMGLLRGKGIFMGWLRQLLLLFILVPPFVHAQSWIFFVDRLSGLSLAAGLGVIDFNGFFPSLLVQAMSYLPISTGLALAALSGIDREAIEDALLMDSGFSTFRRIGLPMASRPMIAGAGLIFLLSLTDYGIPSVFKYNVYALEIFAEYSATGNAAKAFAVALPLLVVCILPLFLYLGGVEDLEMGGLHDTNPVLLKLKLPRAWRLIEGMAFFAILLQMLVPLVNLLLEALSSPNIFKILQSAQTEIYNTLWISFAGSLACVPLSLLAGEWLMRKTGTSKVRWMILLLPMAVPSALTGIGLVSFWSREWLPFIYGTSLMTVLAGVCRFFTLSVVIHSIGMMSIPKELLYVDRLYSPSRLYSWRRVRLPLMAPYIAASILIVFSLIACELGATLLVVPPGNATLTLKIYNYLHYGASDTVALLCLTILALSMAAGILFKYACKWAGSRAD